MGDPRRAQDVGTHHDPGGWLRYRHEVYHVGQGQSGLRDPLQANGWAALRRGRRYWIREHGAEVDIVDIGEELGQMATEVKIAFPMSGYRSNRKGLAPEKDENGG